MQWVNMQAKKINRKRSSMALTEIEYINIKNAILKKAGDNMQLKLFCFYEIMVKTGIRSSEWKYLHLGFKESKTQIFKIFIPKQSKVNKKVTRLIKLPDSVWQYVSDGKFIINDRSTSWVKQRTQQIRKLIENEKFNRPLTPHDFRATFVTMIKHRGWDIFDAQALTQHADIKSLQHYFKADTDLITAVYDSLENDYFDIKNIAHLMKELNKLKMENKYLKVKLKENSKNWQKNEKTDLKRRKNERN